MKAPNPKRASVTASTASINPNTAGNIATDGNAGMAARDWQPVNPGGFHHDDDGGKPAQGGSAGMRDL